MRACFSVDTVISPNALTDTVYSKRPPAGRRVISRSRATVAQNVIRVACRVFNTQHPTTNAVGYTMPLVCCFAQRFRLHWKPAFPLKPSLWRSREYNAPQSSTCVSRVASQDARRTSPVLFVCSRCFFRSKIGQRPSNLVDASTQQVPFFPHPEGAETAGSKLVAVVMTPLFSAQAAWDERKRRRRSDDSSSGAGTKNAGAVAAGKTKIS